MSLSAQICRLLVVLPILLVARACVLDHPGYATPPSPPTSGSRPLLCPGSDDDLTLVSALLTFYTANEDRRSDTAVELRLSGSTSKVQWLAPDVDIPENSVIGPYPPDHISTPRAHSSRPISGSRHRHSASWGRALATGDTERSAGGSG